MRELEEAGSDPFKRRFVYCILPIKTSIRKLRCIACVQTSIALNLNVVVLGVISRTLAVVESELVSIHKCA